MAKNVKKQRKNVLVYPDGSEEIKSLVNDKRFADEDGTTWRRRGSEVLRGKSLQQRVLDTNRRVLHEYLDERTMIEPDARPAFWKRATRLMANSRHADFYGVKFKNQDGDRLLVVHEDC